MVFVTVGTTKQGFRRLLEEVERLASTGRFYGHRILVQFGHTADFHPIRCEPVAFLGEIEFYRRLGEAAIVISHGGTTVLSAVRFGKVPVVMPRQKRYGEHVNDHQVHFAEALAAEGLIVPAYEAADLGAAIDEARQRQAKPREVPKADILRLVASAIEELLAGDEGRR